MREDSLSIKDNIPTKKTPIHIIILTVISWIIVILLISWIFIAIAWWLLSAIWFQDLYIPYSISVTIKHLKLVAVWTIIVLVISRICHIYNPNLYFNHENNLSRDEFEIPYLDWIEIAFTSNDQDYVDHLGQSIVLNHSNENFISKILSYGVILSNRKEYREAVSAFRLIINHPRASLLTKKIAENRLIHLLPYVSDTGMHLSKRIQGGKRNENARK